MRILIVLLAAILGWTPPATAQGRASELRLLAAELPPYTFQIPPANVSETPGVEGRLYRATADGRELLHSWTDGPLELAAPGPGVYRVEVWMTPRQLAPNLGEVAANYTDKPVPWIYSGAIFVR